MAVMRAYMWGAFIPDRVDLSALMRCQTHSLGNLPPPTHHPPQPLASSLLRLLFSSSPHQLGTSSLSSRLRSDSAGVGDTPSLWTERGGEAARQKLKTGSGFLCLLHQTWQLLTSTMARANLLRPSAVHAH